MRAASDRDGEGCGAGATMASPPAALGIGDGSRRLETLRSSEGIHRGRRQPHLGNRAQSAGINRSGRRSFFLAVLRAGGGTAPEGHGTVWRAGAALPILSRRLRFCDLTKGEIRKICACNAAGGKAQPEREKREARR